MIKKTFNGTVSSSSHGMRIDKFLQSIVGEMSRTKLQNLIYDGFVKLNNKVIKETSKKNKRRR